MSEVNNNVAKAESKELLRRTWRGDLLRTSCAESVTAALAGSGLGVTVALKYYDGADWQKGLLATLIGAGMIFTPLTVSVVARLGVRVTRAGAVLLGLSIPGLLIAALSRSLPMLMVGLFLGVPFISATVPLVTAMWRQNADCAIRGRVFSEVRVIAAIFTLASSGLIAWYLKPDLGRYRVVLAVFAGLMLIAALASWRIPSKPLERTTQSNPFARLSLLWRDKLFGYVSLMQMILGFGNLMTMPLRAEFAGSEARGMGYTSAMILLLTLVIPHGARLPAMLIWGRVFDRINFITVRIVINLFFIASIALFFTQHLALQIAGSACFGIAMGGGGVAWNLWVTKFAPPEKTADYMSVHTFLTACRALAGPQLAFAVLGFMTIQSVSYVGLVLVGVSVIMLLPAIKYLHATGRKTGLPDSSHRF